MRFSYNGLTIGGNVFLFSATDDDQASSFHRVKFGRHFDGTLYFL